MAIQVVNTLGKCRIKVFFVDFLFFSLLIWAESLGFSNISHQFILSRKCWNAGLWGRHGNLVADMAMQCMLDSHIVWPRANTMPTSLTLSAFVITFINISRKSLIVICLLVATPPHANTDQWLVSLSIPRERQQSAHNERPYQHNTKTWTARL